MTDLLNCPFCGGDAGKVFFLKGHTPASIGDTQHSETCPLAFSWSGFYRPTPEEAITAWNTRASDAEITRLTEALRAAEEEKKGLREALAFYARENSWKSCGMYMSGRPNPSSAELDAGNKARQALAGAKP